MVIHNWIGDNGVATTADSAKGGCSDYRTARRRARLGGGNRLGDHWPDHGWWLASNWLAAAAIVVGQSRGKEAK